MKTQKEINQAEWANPVNWRGPWGRIYHSPLDTRLMVPKRNPWLGWTFNFAHARAWFILLFLLLAVVVLSIILFLLGK